MPEQTSQTQQTPNSQTPAVNPQQPAETPNDPQDLLAGKYANRSALDQGIVELAQTLGVKVNPNTLGDNRTAVEYYKAMQRLQSRQNQPANPADQTNGQQRQATQPEGDKKLSIEPPQIDPDGGVEQVLNTVGVTAQQITEEWRANNGQLSAETYQKFAAKGYPRGLVDAHLKAEQQVAEQQQAQVIGQAQQIAGGEQQLEHLRQWAATNMDRGRLAKLNQQVEADPSFYPDMIRLIAADYQAAVGAGGSRPLINGGSAPATPAGQIENRSEYFKTIRQAAAGNEQARARLRAHIAAGGSRFV